jgi:HTH-type transcriptional regulator/antitoxin HigA
MKGFAVRGSRTEEPDMAAGSKVQPDSERELYFDLVRRFPLRPLRSDRELSDAIKVIDSLIVRGDLARGEQDYLDILTDIVEKYEADEQPIPPVSESAMLRHLVEARGITQSRLAAETEISMSTISEVLNGRRRFTRRQVSVVAEYFGVPQTVFQLGDDGVKEKKRAAANWPRFFREVRARCDATADGSVDLTIDEIVKGAKSEDRSVNKRSWWRAMMNPKNKDFTGVLENGMDCEPLPANGPVEHVRFRVRR